MSAGEIVKVLTECSSDNLFVLTGLAFMALAVVENIWMIGRQSRGPRTRMGRSSRAVARLR